MSPIKNYYTLGVVLFAATGTFLFVRGIPIAHESWKDYMKHPNNGLTGAVVGVYISGEAVGSLLQIALGDRLGRLRFMSLMCVMVTIGTVIQTASVSIAMFLAGRAVAGMAVGLVSMRRTSSQPDVTSEIKLDRANQSRGQSLISLINSGMVSTVPIYLSEISPPHHRGLIGGTAGCGISAGTMASNWVGFGGSYAPYGEMQWRLPLGVQIPWGLVMMCGLHTFMPQSPRELIRKGRVDEARAEFSKIRRDLGEDEFMHEFALMRGQIEFEMEREIKSYGEIFRLFRHRALVRMGSSQVSQPIVPPPANEQTLIRHRMILWGLFGVMIVEIYAAVMQRQFQNTDNKVGKGFAVLGIYLFVVIFYGMLNSTTWLYGAEVLPMALRNKVMGLAAFSHFVVNVAVTQAGPTAFANIGENYYYVFVGCTFFFLVVGYFYFPETKQKSLEEIAAAFGDKFIDLAEVGVLQQEKMASVQTGSGQDVEGLVIWWSIQASGPMDPWRAAKPHSTRNIGCIRARISTPAMISHVVATLLGLAVTAQAWLPADPARAPLVARDGTTLFNSTADAAEARRHPRRWLPGGSDKIRGVNLGSLFVAEPWMMADTWERKLGCPRDSSEFDCVLQRGQGAADEKFQQHWVDWITQSDFDEMVSYGINTVRIPVGYWIMESIVYKDSEYFPRGGLDHLKRICGYASDRGMYIIIDMHGAPGAQKAKDAFTGQLAPTPGFYQDYQFKRGIDFLAWLRETIYRNNEFRNVGMLEVVNEPLRQFEDGGKTDYMRREFYPKAYQAIRNKESSLGITPNNYLHIQFMNKLWDSGDPQQYLTDNYFAAYDDHRYLKYALGASQQDHDSYLRASCSDDRSGDAAHGWDWPVVVGEWSLSAPFISGQDSYALEWSDGWHPDKQKAFYSRWFRAQVLSYEKHTMGWVFWSWKTELQNGGVKDYRWGYKDAVAAGVIPRDLNSIANSGACDGF
ncbi:hypothetical protein PpBr36_02662 [Pyricularia pennisetigena]|uniref:hypothetical protein n=1 Tax=Pyricularia pennisetigena TaxID=1578925 RepID=UPI00114F38DC|nr:hypothetical protein PpBr36_02662 [Pyricularia pennisetigena]TLS30848.1 hypothetical protein PpBr36_02662 [Pyricularia pennisetigena]